MAIAMVMALLALTLASPAQAQTFSNADLEGTWAVFQLTTPRTGVTGDQIRTYRGLVTFDSTGALTGVNVLADDNVVDPNSYLASGNFSVSFGGVVTGTLLLTNTVQGGPSGTFAVREARLLTNRHTIVGASTVLNQIGLFTFAKQEDAQTFGVVDIGGNTTRDWNYHELTPSNAFNSTFAEGAAWVNGVITFHGLDGNAGCSEADLVLSDGTVRSQTRGTGDFGFG
jgi:hypothetical protein